jgi:hypothetical protein
LSEKAKYFFVFGLYEALYAMRPILPTLRWTSWTISLWLMTWSSNWGRGARSKKMSRRQQPVEDVVDLHLDVVLLPPLRGPRLVEPDVEGRDEMRPGDQGQVALEPATLEPQRSIERLTEARPGNTDRGRSCPCLPQQLATVVPPFAMGRIVGTCH